MLTGLSTLIRLIVIVFTFLSLAALTAAQLETARPRGAAVPSTWDSLSNSGDAETNRIHLIDRSNGQAIQVPAPGEERWDFVSVSPWKDEKGSTEAVGRYTSFSRGDLKGTDASFCGLVRIRLPEAEVVERIELDFLPSGRAAWNPRLADHALIAAASGKLYSYRFASLSDGRVASLGEQTEADSLITPIEWEGELPGGQEPIMTDPVWPSSPQLNNVVIVSLSHLIHDGEGGRRYTFFAPWWLTLSDDLSRIVAAGPLLTAGDVPGEGERTRLRFPTVVARDDRLYLAYLASYQKENEAVLCVGELELDSQSGRPHVRPGSVVLVGDNRFPASAVIPSLDGRWTYSFSLQSGDVLRFPLEIGGDARQTTVALVPDESRPVRP